MPAPEGSRWCGLGCQHDRVLLVDGTLTEAIPFVYNGDVEREPWLLDVLAFLGRLSTAWGQATAEVLEIEGGRETAVCAADDEHPGGQRFRHGAHCEMTGYE